MNRLILFILSIVVSQVIYAQSGDLVVQGSGQDIHLVHIVAPKENWYSVGRIYNISPKEIAPYNHLTIEQPLSIGQQLNIPLTNINFSKKNGDKNSDEALVPVYQAKAGVKSVMGYLKVKAALSPLASKGNSNNVPAKEVVAPLVVAKKEPMAPKTQPIKEETKITPAQEKKPEPVAVAGPDFKGGTFRSQYDPSGKSSSGTAAMFKSTSGWQDGKYYALINDVPIGTIVKITNTSSGKSVYAKVLGNLADMKENAGLAVRISDAAAGELDGEGRFQVEVKY
jgi:LysM repeat protein